MSPFQANILATIWNLVLLLGGSYVVFGLDRSPLWLLAALALAYQVRDHR